MTINFAFIAVRIGKLTVFTRLNIGLRINGLHFGDLNKSLKYLLEIFIRILKNIVRPFRQNLNTARLTGRHQSNNETTHSLKK